MTRSLAGEYRRPAPQRRRPWLALVLAVAAAALIVPPPPAAAQQSLQYNRDIRPILAEHCFACHGPDSAARQADLRLDQRQSAVDAGAIVPGDPDSSEALRRILSDDPDETMPPPRAKKQLSPRQKQRLSQWIAQGAEYQPHWSFIPPVRPPVPQVNNSAWVRNPIDNFILHQLQRNGLAPSPEADRRTLARRLSLDLTGLPPSADLVEAFVADTSADAYERLVDQLLASQRWGEHRARYWLDAARYADTHGIHFDNYREIWAYRDWVIEAFNCNLPFDRFTIEQLAGDLLPQATLQQQIASGFNRCNITTNEGGIIDEEYRVLYTRDRTETTAQVWLGLTAACAVCHSHKFDPLSQREFYELAAFFNNTTQEAKDGNVKDTPPIVVVPQPQDRRRYSDLSAQAHQLDRRLAERRRAARAQFNAWLAAAHPQSLAAAAPPVGLHFGAALDEGQGSTVRIVLAGQVRDIELAQPPAWQPGHASSHALLIQPDRPIAVDAAGNFDRDQAFSCAVWVKRPASAAAGALLARMDESAAHRGWDLWLEDGKIGVHLIHNWPDDAIKVLARRPLKAAQWSHVALVYDGSARADGVKIYVDGQPQPLDVRADKLRGSISTSVPLTIGQRHAGSPADGAAIHDLQIYDRPLVEEEVQGIARRQRIAALLARQADKRTPAETDELFGYWLAAFDEPFRRQLARLVVVRRQQAAIKARGTIAHVMHERDEPPMAYVLFRGEYDHRRDAVSPQTPSALPPMPDHLPRNRLGLAQWLLLPQHPLTARVTVNRFWQEVFGTGLVATAGDFGASGEMPSHPELLDWLAVEFRESGWDVKQLFRLLVTSAAYRQSAAVTPDTLQHDPHNRLLSRGPRFRIDAEMVRDYALAASGLLVEKIGGPSVKPYQPDGVWEAVAMIGSNTRNYVQDEGESLYRRSLYTFWKRSAPPASLEIFNAPSREVCTVRRERTNTPLQALVTLNDPQFVEAARHLAQTTLRASDPAPDERIDFMTRRLLARTLRPEERSIVAASLAQLLAWYRDHPDDAARLLEVGQSPVDGSLDPPELAAWTMLANQLMNLDEVLTK